jgi:hypothetical protein
MNAPTRSALLAVLLLATTASGADPARLPADDRAASVAVLTRVAEPVLAALAEGTLRQRLPVHDWERDRAAFTHLEAFGRTLAGIAPWLELGPDESPEGRMRAHFIDLSVRALVQATDPASPDFLNFGPRGGQPLVDSAFLAHGLLRAPTQVWGRLDAAQRERVFAALKTSRAIKPGQSNWLLFSAMVEAALWEFSGTCEMAPIETAVNRHMDWYLGDGTYGDGPELHWDYYNSYVIQPMLVDVLRVCARHKHLLGDTLPIVLERARRYAAVQERMISPEGTFPIIGRSSAYRFGALQHLAQMALQHELPSDLPPAAVRGALTAVVRRMSEAPGMFDEQGWLQVGAVGHQPSIREPYIATGSLYLCLTGLVHLGLPAEDPLWTTPAQPWTQAHLWRGDDAPADHALREKK